eukprot:2289256-Pyramimonas_sp.AAC.1
MLDAEEQEVELSCADAATQRSQTARIRRRRLLWRKFRRRAVLGSVARPDGSPSESLPEAARALGDHWE